MKKLVILLIVLILPMTTYATDKCKTLLTGDIEKIAKDLAGEWLEAIAYGRDNKLIPENNAKMVDYKLRFENIKLEIPGIGHKINEALVSGSAKKEQPEKVANKRKSNIANGNIITDSFLLHEALFDHPPLVGDEWHTLNKNLKDREVLQRIPGEGNKFYSFEPVTENVRANGEIVERETQAVLHLNSNHVLDVPKFGWPHFIYRLSNDPNEPQVKIGEIYTADSIGDQKPVVLPNNQVFISSAGGTRASLWQWNENGEVKKVKEFAAVNSQKDYQGFRLFGESATLLPNNTLLISNSHYITLWDLNNDDFQAQSISSQYLSDDISNRFLIAIDDRHFISLHKHGQVMLWKIYKDNLDRLRMQVISAMGDREFQDRINKDPLQGHITVPAKNIASSGPPWVHHPVIFEAAALVGKRLLLTAASDGRLVLWKFDFRGPNEVIEVFPNEHPEVSIEKGKKFYVRHPRMHKGSVEKFRFEIVNGQLWVESGPDNDRIVWKPLSIFEGEL